MSYPSGEANIYTALAWNRRQYWLAVLTLDGPGRRRYAARIKSLKRFRVYMRSRLK